MKWIVDAPAKRPVRHQKRFRATVEQLENRLTPSGLTALNASVLPIAIVPEAISQDSLIVSPAPQSPTSVSGGFVTGTRGGATAEGVAVGADGSVYVTGRMQDVALSPNQLLYVVKYFPSGAIAYSAALGAFPDTDLGSTAEGTGIGVDSAGNVYVSAKAHDGTAGTDSGFTLKLDPTGTMAAYAFAWTFASGTALGFNGIAIDTAGDAVYVGGETVTPTETVLVALRLDPTGTSTYFNAYSFGPGTSSQGNAAAMPGSGTSTTIVGWVNLGGTADQDAAILNLDASGTLIAAASVPSPGVDSLNAVALDGTGNICAAGTLDAGGPTNSALALKVDHGIANVLWLTAPAGSMVGNGIALTSAGDVVWTGADAGGQAFISLLSGVNGSVTDYTTFGGTGGSDVGQAVAVRTGDGHIFAVGTTNSSDFPVTDASTLTGTTDGFLTEWTYA
jgi:hypothetical protein